MMLAVIMQHGVVERIDALEILGIERVLGADPVGGLGVRDTTAAAAAPARGSTGTAGSARGSDSPAAATRSSSSSV